jgi:hypothetical protein
LAFGEGDDRTFLRQGFQALGNVVIVDMERNSVSHTSKESVIVPPTLDIPQSYPRWAFRIKKTSLPQCCP